MAAVVGFVSEKGGVGKTTACYEIAWDLRWTHGCRVMVVDTDYQRGGITCRFIPDLIENFREGRVPGTHLYHKYQHLYSETELIRMLIFSTPKKRYHSYLLTPG